MPVCRVIFRVDYDTVFEVMDRPGFIAKTISEVGGKGFFSELKEEASKHEVFATGRSADGNEAYLFTVGLTAISLSFETVAGIPAAEVSDNATLKTLMRIVTAIRKAFDVVAENRIGLRVFYFSTPVAPLERSRQAIRKLMSPAAIEACESTLGPSTDYALCLDGKEHDVSYRLRFGPYLGRDEPHTYIEMLKEKFMDKNSYTFMCDLDQFETQTKYGPDLKLWKPYLGRVSTFIAKIEKAVIAHAGEKDLALN